MYIALLKEVGEFRMDPHCLLVADAKGLPVDQALDGGHLVEQNQVGVMHIIVNGVKIALQKSIFKHVHSSLLQAHPHDATTYLKKILNDIVASVGRSRM